MLRTVGAVCARARRPRGSWCMRALVAVGAAAAVPSSFDGGGCRCRLVVVLGCSSWPWTVVAVAGFGVMGTHRRCGRLCLNAVVGCCGRARSCAGGGRCGRGRWWSFCTFACVGGWWSLWVAVLFVVHLSWLFVFAGGR